ncbi:MAG: peptide ABC transporter substrate-binding protein [Anaeroplasmataceae bacterium]
MNFKKVLFSGTLATVAALGLASCKSSSELKPLAICIASTPDHIDPALNSSVDGATYDVHLFSGLVRYVGNKQTGELELAPDLCTEIPVGSATSDGKVKYIFTLRDGITFSDGTPIVASDFVKSWNRAASHTAEDTKGTETEDDDVVVTGLDGDYCYMFDCIDGYYDLDDKAEAGTLSATDKFKLNVTAVNDKTLEVVCPVALPYFNELLAFPAYQVLKNADTLSADGAWAKSSSCVTSGAYTIKKYEEDVELVLQKNDAYWDSSSLTQDEITFVFSDDDSSTYGQYQTGDIQFMNNLPQSMIAELQKDPEYHVIGQLGTYYYCFNINSSAFAGKTQAEQEEIRNALNLLIPRKYICDSVAQGGQTPSTGFVGAGLSDPKGGEFVDHNGVNGDGSGYCGDANNQTANNTKAIEILDKYYTKDSEGKYTNFPTLNFIYNTNDAHKAIAEAVQAAFATHGIKVNISNEEWAQFLNTRKQGNYDFARNGWLADYNDPISFLDMWTTDSGNNDCQLGREAAASFTYSVPAVAGYEALNGTWAETYDVLIARVKSISDANKRYELMHAAETLLMQTGCILPIYNYVDTYMQSSSLTEVYSSPLGFKYFMWCNYSK